MYFPEGLKDSPFTIKMALHTIFGAVTQRYFCKTSAPYNRCRHLWGVSSVGWFYLLVMFFWFRSYFYLCCHNKKSNISNKSVELLRASIAHKVQTLGLTYLNENKTWIDKFGCLLFQDFHFFKGKRPFQTTKNLSQKQWPNFSVTHIILPF